MDCDPPGSFVYGIFQARIVEWVSPRDLPDPGIESASLASPALAGGFFTTSATWAALSKRYKGLKLWRRGRTGKQGVNVGLLR